MRFRVPRLLRPGRFFGRGAEGGAPKPGIVNHVSLGTVCHTASALRDAGLRRWTGPFDWVFSVPRMVADCVRDDFAELLDPAQLRSVPAAELSGGATRQCRHVGYEGRYGLPILFNHHDPAGSAEDRAALGRAVARLRTALGGAFDNVFYVTAVDYELPAADAEALAAALAGLPSRNRLVVISVTTGQDGRRSLTREPLAGGAVPMLGVRLRTGSAWRALRFADPADDALLETGLRDAAASLAPDRSAGR